jgi:hypothetical protein
MKLDKVEIPVIMFLIICGVMIFTGFRWGRSATLKKYCCYGGCSGGSQCGCMGINPEHRILT